MGEMIRQKVIQFFMQNDLLLDPDIIKKIPKSDFNLQLFYSRVLENRSNLTNDILSSIISEIIDESKKIVDSKEVIDYDDDIDDRLKKFNVKFLQNYIRDPEKRAPKDFISHYNKRMEELSKILRQRQELDDVTSISRISQSEGGQKISVIGMVYEKAETKNGHLIFTLEDKTGSIKVLVSKNRKEQFDIAQDIMLDETIGVVGNLADSREIMFCDEIIFPDVALHKPLTKSPYDNYSVFISDVHVGSKTFMEEEFLRFIDWINGKVGSAATKEIAMKVKYLFIVGDLVEGIGIFPNQEKEISIMDIYKQHEKLAEYLKMIREDICIIVVPGNHEPMRIAEPQPLFYKDYAKALYEMPNIIFSSSPSSILIDSTEVFEGLEVLLYHGFSIPFYADRVPSIRKNGGQGRVDLVMEYYLTRRHFAPTHTSTQFISDPDYDFLTIKSVPDILATGHIHRYVVGRYRNVDMFNCSCWCSLTDYQIKNGIEAQPCRAILVHHKTRKVNVLKFGQDEYEGKLANKKTSN